MRNILFRGKRLDNGEWVYGFPFSAHANLIVEGIETWDGERHLIGENTVGQFTGLLDKKGNKIFEGDIVKAKIIENKWSSSKKYTDVYEVAYHSNFCYFYLKKNGNNLLFDGNWSYAVSIEEVMGNIHDNPELLEE